MKLLLGNTRDVVDVYVNVTGSSTNCDFILDAVNENEMS